MVLIVGCESRDKVAQGSGFIVGKDKIATNYHVIAGLSTAFVLFADGHAEPVTASWLQTRIKMLRFWTFVQALARFSPSETSSVCDRATPSSKPARLNVWNCH
ncbi:MAG TPA: hypothetical protein VMU45_04705 [Candidatus Eisenbacteria bacterium]|nr:hypothetical protein [Candidatus Eisenbacteria bacterium]